VSTLREDFEPWFRDDFMNGMDDAGEWDAERNCYVIHQVHMAWKGYQAATERAANLAATLAYDAAIKYANGREVDFEREVGDAIRAASMHEGGES
jgi:hypothetical protein